MVGVVKKRSEAVAFARGQNGANHFRRVPFMHDHDVRVAQFFIEKGLETLRRIAAAVQVGKGGAEFAQGLLRSRLFQQVDIRPAVLRFVAADFVAQSPEFVGKAAEEMSVAVIPVGAPGMREESKPQRRTHARDPRELEFCRDIRTHRPCAGN